MQHRGKDGVLIYRKEIATELRPCPGKDLRPAPLVRPSVGLFAFGLGPFVTSGYLPQMTTYAKTIELELSEPILQDELVERCKLGDSRGFAELYRKYSKAMYNTSLRIVNNTGDAEDVVQEAFTDAFRSLEELSCKSTVGAWLKRMIINKSINYLRKRKMDLIDIEKTNIGHLPEEETLDEKDVQK